MAEHFSEISEWAKDAKRVLERFARCPLYYHGYDDPRRRRIDCADDQCQNPEHTRYVRCDHRSHDAADLVASFPVSLTANDPVCGKGQ